MTHKQIITKSFQLWLAAGCKTYGEAKEDTIAKIPIYATLLADVSGESLSAACQECAKTCTDFPTVADVRKAAERIAETKRAELRASGERIFGNPDCPWCWGSGWEPMSGCSNVTKCRCRRPGFILPPPQPRKMLTEAEKSALAASLGLRTGEE